MTSMIEAVKQFLADSRFEIYANAGPFAFVAQNPNVLVFVVETNQDLLEKVRSITNFLAGPFRGKKFGPKTMEMYCIFVSDLSIPVSAIEQCEQDLRVCRKVVVTNQGHIEGRLSFLKSLEDVLAVAPDANALFWKEASKYLNPVEISFLKSLLQPSIELQQVLSQIPRD